MSGSAAPWARRPTRGLRPEGSHHDQYRYGHSRHDAPHIVYRTWRLLEDGWHLECWDGAARPRTDAPPDRRPLPPEPDAALVGSRRTRARPYPPAGTAQRSDGASYTRQPLNQPLSRLQKRYDTTAGSRFGNLAKRLAPLRFATGCPRRCVFARRWRMEFLMGADLFWRLDVCLSVWRIMENPYSIFPLWRSCLA